MSLPPSPSKCCESDFVQLQIKVLIPHYYIADKASDTEKRVKHGSFVEAYKANLPDVNERKLIAKIDLRLIPAICLLYVLAFLDRYVLTRPCLLHVITLAYPG
jgi:hypothetical protein